MFTSEAKAAKASAEAEGCTPILAKALAEVSPLARESQLLQDA